MAWCDTPPRSPRTTPMIESVSACGWSYTAVNTATRGRVTRRAAPRNMRSKSEVVGTRRSVPQFLESIKNQASALDLMFEPPARIAALAGRDGQHGRGRPGRHGDRARGAGGRPARPAALGT